MKRARARHRLSEHERGSQEGRAAPIWRARGLLRGFPFQTPRRAPECPRVVCLGVLRENLVGRLTRFGLRPSGREVVSRIRTRFTRTSFKQKARRSTSTIDRRRRRTVPSYGSADDPPRRRRLGRRRRHRGETFVSFIVGTSARVVDPSIHRSSRAARLTNTLVRSRALWDLSRPLSSSARGTRAPPSSRGVRPCWSLEKRVVPSSCTTSNAPSRGTPSSDSWTMTVGKASSRTSASWMKTSTLGCSNSTFTTVGGGASRPERHAYPRDAGARAWARARGARSGTRRAAASTKGAAGVPASADAERKSCLRPRMGVCGASS